MNYCYVDPAGGPIVVQIEVDNGTRSNWNCAHAKKENDKWSAIDSFRLNSGDEGTDTYLLISETKSMGDTTLLWRVRACGTVAGAERAQFFLRILQDGKHIFEKLSDRMVPQCANGKAIIFRNMVEFKLHSNQEKVIDIWDVL